MYGLFPALMESRRLRDQEDQAAQEMAVRQRRLAMDEEQHRLATQEAGLRLRQQQGVEAAQKALTGLTQRDTENQQFLSGGGVGPVQPVTDRDINNAQLGLAYAKGDLRSAQDLHKQNRMLDVSEEAKRLSADPAFQGKVMSYISTKEIFPLKVEPGQRDPKTGRMKTADRLVFDSGYQYDLKEGDRQRIALGAALMNKGMTEEGLKVIEGVNKELRDAVDHANNRTIKASEFNSRADDRLADNELRAEQIAAARAARAAAGANRNREIPPEILRELSALEQQYIGADPKARPAIERQYQMVLSRAGAAVGKPLGLPSPRPAPETKVNADGSVLYNGMLYLPDPKKPGAFVPAKGIGPSNLDRALEAYTAGGGAPAPTQQPAGLVRPQRPPGAPANYGVYGTPGYDQYTQDQLLEQYLQSRSAPTGLNMPLRPVDFTKYNTPRQ